MNKYIVETVSMFRMRYIVETSDPNYARDMVENMEEFSQLHIGNPISSVREVTTDEYIKIFDEDNQYLSGWTDEQKLAFIFKQEKI
jgi:hypothetical protein